MSELVRSRTAVSLSTPSVYGLVACASILLSLWGAYAQYIPNPDAMYYLRSAEMFADGRWREGFQIFRWPLYSLGIASVMSVTGVSALIASQVINAVLDAATALLFVALVARFASGSRQLVFWAAFFVLLHPKLVQVRPSVIRDHGFYTFFLLTLYLVVLDLTRQRLVLKLGTFAAIVLACLFRPEAAALFLLIPAFYIFNRTSSTLARTSIVIVVILSYLMLVPAYSLWNFMGAHANIAPADWLDVWARLTREIFRNVTQLSSQLETILPRGRNVGGLAYIGIVAAITVDSMLRAVTIPIAVLTVLAFTPRRVMPAFAGRFVGWFAWWQLPLLLTFMTFALFLDWRYAMGFALLAGIPAVFTLHAAATDAQSGGWRDKFLLIAAVAAVVIPFALAVPKISNLAHLRDAGYWVRDKLPPEKKVLTNEGRIAYYSGRTYDKQIKVLDLPRLKEGLANADYLLLSVERGVTPSLDGVEAGKQVDILKGAGERRVIVYRLR
jgi:hypothetical protein